MYKSFSLWDPWSFLIFKKSSHKLRISSCKIGYAELAKSKKDVNKFFSMDLLIQFALVGALLIFLLKLSLASSNSSIDENHTGLARYEFYFKFWDIGGVLICGPAFSRNCRWRFIWFWPILTAHVLLLISYLPNERSTCKQNKKICAIYIKCDKMAWPRTCYQNFQSRQHIH